MKRRLFFKTCSRTPDELEKEMAGSKINGHDFNTADTSSVTEICGNIGVVYPPADYAAWPQSRIYSIHHLDRGVIGYAAVRLTNRSARRMSTFIIDSFGVLDSARKEGIGKSLFEYIKEDTCTRRSDSWYDALLKCGMMAESESYTLSIQSTFDFGSYCKAISDHTLVSNSGGSQIATIDMTAVLKNTHGSCDFWRKMGFDGEKVIYSGDFNVAEPIIIMWQKIK